MKIRDFEDLIVWQKSIDLITDIYQVTNSFPREERFGLTSQIRNAAVSIASNIAEGNGRGTTKDYVHFLSNSRGSLYEVRSLIVVSEKLDFLDHHHAGTFSERANEIGRMLSALRTSLRRTAGTR